MTEQTPAHQFVTIEHPDTVAVFASPREDDPEGRTRVFYDLDALFGQYAPAIMARGLIARLKGDETAQAANAGETLLLEGIRQSVEALRMEADLSVATADDFR